MPAHLGILALMVAVVAATLGRGRRTRSPGALLVVTLATLVAALESARLVGERGTRSGWEDAASRELTARVERIVAFLRDEGAGALDRVRAIGDDPDTRTLLGPLPEAAQTARRPVFLDLVQRFPAGGPAGVTVYDRNSVPRAWAGWSPPATMLLSREPSAASETVGIREGNVYTLLEVVHPVTGSGGEALGFVAYQRPLRVQYPLESRLLRVEDALQRLEGGGGARASVALVLDVADGADVRSLRCGPAKLDVRGDVASGSAAILSATGDAVGRVSLEGLARSSWAKARLVPVTRARDVLLLLVAILVLVRAWTAARGWPAPLGVSFRLALVVASRLVLREVVPRTDFSALAPFDPAWFASIRFGGLFRSPGDALLTSVAVLLGARELRRLVLASTDRLAGVARRSRAAPVAGALLALLVGSLVGRHWTQVVEFAHNANLALYDGLDPFTSSPVATLEAALLAAGLAFLVLGDGLVSGARALLGPRPRSWITAALLACTWLASAVKMGSPSRFAWEDFVRPLPALLALAAYHALRSRAVRPAALSALAASCLAAVANFAPLTEGVEGRRRELVELHAVEHTESPSSSRHFLVERIAESVADAPELHEALAGGLDAERAGLAFVLWARSPLSSVAAGSFLRLSDGVGRNLSEFGLGYPPEIVPPEPRGEGRRVTRFRREEIGPERVDVYSVLVPVESTERVLGSVQLSMAWFDQLGRPEGAPRTAYGLLSTLQPSPEYQRFARSVPERVDRYSGDRHVSSTDLEEGLLISPAIVKALSDESVDGRWERRRIGRKLWDLYCVRERDGEGTVGYLTFGIERRGLLHRLWLLARSTLVSLLFCVAATSGIALLARVAAPGGRAPRFALPRPGFRERVIGGLLLVSLLPTVLLGTLGRNLFVEQKRSQFREGLEEDLRVSRELVGRRLLDAARNAAASEEVHALLAQPAPARALSTPASVDGIVVLSEAGEVVAASRRPDFDLQPLLAAVGPGDAPVEFFHRAAEETGGRELVACALVPLPGASAAPGGPHRVLAFQRVGAALAAELERRVGSPIGFFTDGLLVATSKPELYRSEILSDLVDPGAYLRIELEGAQRVFRPSRAGATSLLASYAPLRDEKGRPAGILAALAPHPGWLDPDASVVLSHIYFLCLLVVVAAIAGALVLASRLTRPISELTEGAERIRAGRLGERISSRATGEIGRLIRSFNLMSERLAESEARDRERREYIEAIIRHVGSGVVSFDARGRVATVNQAASRILAVDPEAMLGREIGELRGNPALDAILLAVRPVLSEGRSEVVHELDATGPEDAEARTIRLVATLLADRDGRAQGAVAVFEDLTELIRSKKITAWAEMARQVAHEIKNPLTPMKLSAQHLRQAWRDRHPKFDRILEESTETIVDRCEALRRIAIEFADYARMPGRRVRREDLGRLLREAQRLYGDSNGRAVDFRMDAPLDEIFARVDRDEVMRLFINLIENSIQAMPHGGDLQVRARREDGSATVTIRDSGVGIPSGNLPRIFEPSFSTKTGGAGLGLPICKAIIEDYGGSISIASATGEGTTVTLTFPVEETAPGDAPGDGT
jgi:PAS domain S-box-containing protein